MKSYTLIILLFATGCATGFVPSNGSGLGYEVKAIEKPSFYQYSASYLGNAKTSVSQARSFTEMAAIEKCLDQSLLPIMMKTPVNLTKSYSGKEVSSIGSQVYSYSTLRTYPAFLTFFRCDKGYRVLNQNPGFKVLSANLIKDHVDDFKGGLQVVGFLDKAKGALKINDVVLSVDGARVQKELDLYYYIAEAKGDKVKMTILRKKKKKHIEAELLNDVSRRIEIAIEKISEFCDANTVHDFEMEKCIAKQKERVNAIRVLHK
ncbi:MAG: PDZ domain-containing protein [Bdellovibrionales bacterium]